MSLQVMVSDLGMWEEMLECSYRNSDSWLNDILHPRKPIRFLPPQLADPLIQPLNSLAVLTLLFF